MIRIMWTDGKRRRGVPVVCAYCGGDFLAPKYLVDIGDGRFCSRTCSARGRKTAEGLYRGGQLKHTVVAEKALGKPLPKGAIVHHVNGDGLDNRHANLVICQDTKYHALLHVRTRVLRAGGNPNTDRVCVMCCQPCPVVNMRGSNRRGHRCIPCAAEAARSLAAQQRARYRVKKASHV